MTRKQSKQLAKLIIKKMLRYDKIQQLLAKT
jgi:hypothetical protein